MGAQKNTSYVGADTSVCPYGVRDIICTRNARRRGMKASVATATRYDSVACDDGRFISLKERALALLTLVSPRSCDISLAHPLFGTFSFSSSCLQLVEIKEMEYYHFRAGWPDRLPATTALHRGKSVL